MDKRTLRKLYTARDEAHTRYVETVRDCGLFHDKTEQSEEVWSKAEHAVDVAEAELELRLDKGKWVKFDPLADEHEDEQAALTTPTVSPALAPATEHRVKLPTLKVAPAPEPPAITYGVLGNPSLDTIIAHLGDALEWELSGEEDAGEFTLRRHITDAIVEAERYQAARKEPLIWPSVLDMLAGPQGWKKWQQKVAQWTQFRASHFDPPILIEGHEPDIWCAVMGFIAGWQVSHPELYGKGAEELEALLADVAPQAQNAGQTPRVEPAPPPSPQNGKTPPAARLIGQWYDVNNFREACRALKAYQHEFNQKPSVIKLPYEVDKKLKGKGDDLRMRGNVLGVRIVFDKAVHVGKAWVGVVPETAKVAAA